MHGGIPEVKVFSPGGTFEVFESDGKTHRASGTWNYNSPGIYQAIQDNGPKDNNPYPGKYVDTLTFSSDCLSLNGINQLGYTFSAIKRVPKTPTECNLRVHGQEFKGGIFSIVGFYLGDNPTDLRITYTTNSGVRGSSPTTAVFQKDDTFYIATMPLPSDTTSIDYNVQYTDSAGAWHTCENRYFWPAQ